MGRAAGVLLLGTLSLVLLPTAAAEDCPANPEHCAEKLVVGQVTAQVRVEAQVIMANVIDVAPNAYVRITVRLSANVSAASGTVEAKVALEQTEGVQIRGKDTETVTFPAGESREVVFDVVPVETSVDNDVLFVPLTVRSGADEGKTHVPIRPVGQPVAVPVPEDALWFGGGLLTGTGIVGLWTWWRQRLRHPPPL